MEFPLDVNCCFSFAAFNIFFVVFILCLINMCLGMFLLGFILCLVVPLGLDWLFPFPCWRNFQLYSLQKCSHTLSLSLLHLGSLQLECAAFDIVPEVSEAILSCFHPFCFILHSEVISTILSSSSLIHSSASDNMLLIPSRIC